MRRLFEVLDGRLQQSEWLGDDFSIADIANWCWVRTYKWTGVAVDDLPGLRRWLDVMKQRPKCRAGIEVPASVPPNLLKDAEGAAAFARNAAKILQK
jgi:glutathione S-transferase